MNNRTGESKKRDTNSLIYCAMCKHFRQFHNEKDHNSPHALGECLIKSWDGNRGQWAMFLHHCDNLVRVEQN